MAEAKKASSKKSKPIADVARPNTSAPSASARPVIVTNRPILKDPMVIDKDDPPAKDDSAANTVTVKVVPATENKPAEDAKPAESKELTKTPVPPADDTPRSGFNDEEPAKPAADAAEQEAAEAAQAEHDTAIQKLVDSKQYFLPINTVEKRKSKRFVALGIILSVVLALAWADIALDAGLIQINGVKPLTHFFSN